MSYPSAATDLPVRRSEKGFQRSGLSWRFNLLVPYLLDHQAWPVERLLREPWPDQARVEAEFRAGR